MFAWPAGTITPKSKLAMLHKPEVNFYSVFFFNSFIQDVMGTSRFTTSFAV